MKKDFHAFQRISFLLCMVMLAGLLSACNVEDTNENATTASPDATKAPTIGTELVDGYVPDSLDGLNFDREVLLLASHNQRSHFYADEATTTVIGKAIYKRNETVENRLGIELKWELRGDNAESEKNDFIKLVEADIQSGHEIDAVASYNLTPYTLASKGYCTNLAETEHIDLSGPWWPTEFLDHMLYNGKIFALVGSCGVGTLTNLSGVFFNNDLLEAKKLESPYDLVKKNEWTIPKLQELIKDTYEDKNHDGKENSPDVYGLCTSSSARMSCWYYGAGLRFSEMDENGQLRLIANDVEKFTAVLDSIAELFNTQDAFLYEDGSTRYTIFKEERVYFYLSTLTLCTNMVNAGVTVNYGVVPNPKFNSEQERYYTHLPNSHEAWYIPTGVDDLDCSSAFLECMASEAYRQLNEVFFETNLKLRYAPDDRLAAMYDLIRESITFDFVYVYKNVFSANCDSVALKCMQKPESNKWATSWGQISSSVIGDFEKMLAIYQ